jgi:hypothetical protein
LELFLLLGVWRGSEVVVVVVVVRWSLRAEKVCSLARGENLVGEILENSISSFLLHASYEA